MRKIGTRSQILRIACSILICLFCFHFPYLFAAEVETHPSIKEICKLLLMRTTGNTSKVSIDESKRREWVKRQPKKYRAFAEIVSSQIHIYSREEFLENFKKSVFAFKATLKPEDKVVFIFDDGHDDFKSGNWLMGYLIDTFPELSHFPVNRSGNLHKTDLTDRNTRIVFVDDALFEASNFLSSVHSIRQNKVPHESIEALVPFATSRAVKRVTELGIETPYIQKKFRSLKEKSDFKGIAIPPVMESWVFEFSNDFLDHNLPDSFSFPSFISIGNILNKQGTGFVEQTTPFINAPVPFYKQVKRLDLDTERKELLDSFRSPFGK